MNTNITILGLLCDIVGALLLGYDILVHPSKAYEKRLLESRGVNVHRTYDNLIEDARKRDPKVFSQDEINKWVEYLEMRRKMLLEAQIEAHVKNQAPFEFRRIRYGAIGILLLILGFILQAVGVSQ
ncbi:MAG: hypothetical protein L0H63_11250 [Nitrococcus sp.]|nr:hypothetical protein [Nitrococcus sp.]